ncbi:hypothetical protein F01_570146 [Burkholderia cenocepacia]|nr:hypothetical protein F01_570146 [Burkholderia cenocepacia]
MTGALTRQAAPHSQGIDSFRTDRNAREADSRLLDSHPFHFAFNPTLTSALAHLHFEQHDE